MSDLLSQDDGQRPGSDDSPGISAQSGESFNLSASSLPSVRTSPTPVVLLERALSVPRGRNRDAAFLRLWRALSSERKSYSGRELSSGFLAHAHIELGAEWLRDPRRRHLVEEIVFTGLAHNNGTTGGFSRRMKGLAVLAERHVGTGEFDLAVSECEYALGGWDRLHAGCPHVGRVLLVYGKALKGRREYDLGWRQFQAASGYYVNHMQVLKGRCSDLLYSGAMQEWAEHSVDFPGRGTEHMVVRMCKAYRFLTERYGESDPATLEAKLHMIRAFLLGGYHADVDQHCAQIQTTTNNAIFNSGASRSRNPTEELAPYFRASARAYTCKAFSLWLRSRDVDALINLLKAAQSCTSGLDDRCGNVTRVTRLISRDFRKKLERERGILGERGVANGVARLHEFVRRTERLGWSQ